MKHKSTPVGPTQEDSERYSLVACRGAETHTAAVSRTNAPAPSWMEAVVERGNMRWAYQRVVENKGAPGVDGLRVDELKDWLRRNWPTVRAFVAQGKRWVVDIDLEKFFDRVNHDILMSRVARRITDERVLKLIRRYLEAGLMREGLSQVRTQGTPQGGPLSPLLSNLVLDDLDRELERRGHCFCRYADDCNIYVASRTAAQHAMKTITQFLEEELKLRVNRDKSAWARPWERKFLGYSFTWHRQTRLRIAAESLQRLCAKVRECLRAGRGRSLQATIAELTPMLRGWMSYFRLTQVLGVLEDLDGWVRRKLRSLIWRQWKRVATRAKALQKRGISEPTAWSSATNGRGAWWNAGAAHMHAAFAKSYFDRLGLVSLVDSYQRWRVFS